MGFSSGLPLALTGATFAIWLSDAHVSNATIARLSLVTTVYALKFLWAPLVDRVPLPVVDGRLGRRRSWALLTQAALMLALVGLGASDPATAIGPVVFWAFAVAAASATQDIVIDATRVELLDDAEQGLGAALTQTGYRLGMIAAGAGALAAAELWGWWPTYLLMAALVPIGMAGVLIVPEPAKHLDRARPGWVGRTFVAPFAAFVARNRRWGLTLVFVVLYFLGDAMVGKLSGPLYRSLGYSKGEIAEIGKILGLAASIAGLTLGGVIVARFGILTALVGCGLAKIAGILLYLPLIAGGHDLRLLAAIVTAENFAGGAAESAYVAFLSRLCTPGHTATQYALLSALAAVPRTFLASSAGDLQQALGWPNFILLSAALALPALILLGVLGARPDHPRVTGQSGA